MDTRVGESNIEDILTVRDFSYVLHNDLPELPPDYEVEFSIDLISNRALISLAPCRMALFE